MTEPTFTLTFTLREADAFWRSAASHSAEYGDAMSERFESLNGQWDRESKWETAAAALTDPVFTQASIVWCHTMSDALMFAKIHQSAGHETALMWDTRTMPGQNGYAVLTSHDVLRT